MSDKTIDFIIGIIPTIILFVIDPAQIIIYLGIFTLYIIYIFFKYKFRNKK